MNRSGAPLPAVNAARYLASKSAYGIWTGLIARFPPGNDFCVCSAQYGPILVHWSEFVQIVSVVVPAAAGLAAVAAAAWVGFAAAGAVVAAGCAAGAAGFYSVGFVESAGLAGADVAAGAAGGEPQAARIRLEMTSDPPPSSRRREIGRADIGSPSSAGRSDRRHADLAPSRRRAF